MMMRTFVTSLFALIFMISSIQAKNNIPFEFRGERQSKASQFFENLTNSIQAVMNEGKKLKGHLKKMKGQIADIQKQIKEAKDHTDFYNRLPVRRLPKEESKKLYNFLSKSQGKLKKLSDSIDKKIKTIDKGIAKLGDAKSSIKEFRKLDPENMANDPTYGLSFMGELIKNGAGKIAKSNSGLSKLLTFYAEATVAFAGALKRLDKSLENQRQNILCSDSATRNVRATTKFIQEKTPYACQSDCRVVGSWPTFPNFLVTRCTEGYVFYNGKIGKGYHISHPNEVELIHSWMLSEDINKKRRNIWWLKEFVSSYQRDKKLVEKERKRVIKHTHDIQKFFACKKNKTTQASMELLDFANQGSFAYLKEYIINPLTYARRLKATFKQQIDRDYLFTGQAKAQHEGKPQSLRGISLSINNGPKGKAVGSMRVQTDKSFCLKVSRKRLQGTPFFIAKKAKFAGAGNVENFDPEMSHHFISPRLTQAENLLSDILAEAESLANKCQHKPCDQCRPRKGDSCVDCSNKPCQGVCRKSKKCLPCMNILCSECTSEIKTACIADKEPPKKEENEQKPNTDNQTIAKRCQNALDKANYIKKQYQGRRLEFRTTFASENGSNGCSSNRAAYYFVELSRLQGEFEATLDFINNMLQPLGYDNMMKDELLRACFDRYGKAKDVGRKIANDLAKSKARFEKNNCDLRVVENEGSLFPPGMSSAEVDTRVGTAGGLWQSSTGGAPFCITDAFIQQTVKGLTTSFNTLIPAGFSTNVTSNGNTITATATTTNPGNDCTITTNMRYVLSLQASTGTQSFSLSFSGTGSDCSSLNGIQNPFTFNSSITKVSNSCNLSP